MDSLVKKFSGSILSRLMVVSALCFLLVRTGDLHSFFDSDVGNNGVIRLAFDIDGSVTIAPFIIQPTGEVINLSPVTISSTTGLTFDDQMFPDPYSGTFFVGAIITGGGSGTSTVSLNRSISRVTNSGTSNVIKFRSATSTDGATTVSAGETALIMVPVTVHSNVLNSI